MSGGAVVGVALSVSVSVSVSLSRCRCRCCALHLYGRRRPSFPISFISQNQDRNRNRNDVSVAFIPTSSRITRSRRRTSTAPRATPHEVLGVAPSASPQEIKRAYRRLALRFHPDVNKEPDAQERFMRIKHAYNTLMINSNSYTSSSSYAHQRKQPQQSEEEDFYGLADFLRDLQEEFRNWEADINTQDKPKSLWEELSAIGEEFVEFLEKELNVKDAYADNDSMSSQKEKRQESQPSVEQSIDEVEAALAQLKKELGL